MQGRGTESNVNIGSRPPSKPSMRMKLAVGVVVAAVPRVVPLLACALVLAQTTGADADVYRYVDRDGVEHYTNVQPKAQRAGRRTADRRRAQSATKKSAKSEARRQRAERNARSEERKDRRRAARAQRAAAHASEPVRTPARGRVTDTDACAAEVTLFTHAAQDAAELTQVAAEAAAEALAAAREARRGPRHPELLARARDLAKRASGAAERAWSASKVAAERARDMCQSVGRRKAEGKPAPRRKYR